MESLVDKIILLKIPEEFASFCSCKELNKSVTTDLKFLLAFLAIQLCCSPFLLFDCIVYIFQPAFTFTNSTMEPP